MKKTIIKKAAKRITAMALAALLGLSVPMASYAAAIKESNFVISDVNTARAALEKIASERNIAAAIYLKDSYILKSKADPYSEDVVALASGQSISIVSVDVDEGRNVWYKVNYSYAGGVISGYAEREFVACADERFLEWEDKYITTTSRENIRKETDCTDIEQFPKEYRDALYELKKKHPNWVFVRQNIKLDWKSVLNQESRNERSLIYKSADSSYKVAPSAGTADWYIATEGIIAYYMDPRNFLTEERVFMFEQLTYNESSHSVDAVQKILNSTFMSGGYDGSNKSYAQTFVEIGSALNMSPIALASRVRQEQGTKGTSPLISGKYSGFEGYYNYFNIRANGSTKELIYKNGLSYAKEKGWNTRERSLSGGASIIASNYVLRGQDTIYLQKFDVDASDNTLYTHQYMQNIVAPYNESYTTYKAYNNAGLMDNTFVFKIPVYDNMPKGRCIKPNATDVLSLNVDEVKNLPVDQNAVLISLINGGQNNDAAITYTSSDERIAKVDSNGVITGIKPGNVTISAKRSENTTNTVTCKVNVIKADIALSKIPIPELSTTYSPDQTLEKIKLPDGFTWVDKSIIPAVENEGYSVVYNPDNSRYNEITITVPISVAKATVDETAVNMPKDLVIDVGAELATVVLPEGFVWEDSSLTAPKKTGNVKYKAIYCKEPASYEPLSMELSVKVVCSTHEFGDWKGVHADCENTGEITRTCLICGHKETITEEALGHKYTSEITKEPTTKKTGIRTYTCERCADTYTEEIPKLKDDHVHTYTKKVTKEPDCLTEGVMTYTCSCGDSYDEPIEALGHDYNDSNVCKRCGYELKVIPVHIHDFTLSSNTATCTQPGIKTYTCGCGESYTEEAEKLGHDMKNGECTRCDYREKNTTPAATPSPTVDASATNAAATNAAVQAEATKAAAATNAAVQAEATKSAAATNAAIQTEATKTAAATNAAMQAEATKAATATNAAIQAEATKAAMATNAAATNAAVTKAVAEVTKTPAVTPEQKPTPIPTPTPTPKPIPVATVEPTPTPKATESASQKADEITPNTKKDENETSAAITPASEPVKKTDKADRSEKNTADNSKATPVVPQIERIDEFEQGQKPVEMVLMSTTVLDKEKIEEYSSEDNRKLRITMANDVAWDMDLTDTSIDDINIDLKVELDSVNVAASNLEDVIDGKPFTSIDIKHDGVFGFPVTLHIPSDRQYAGKIANLFYNNPVTGLLEYVNDTVVGDDGDTAFILEHASQYVIVYADASLKPLNVTESDTGSDEVKSIETDTDDGILITSEKNDGDGANYVLIAIISVAVLIVIISIIAVILYMRKRDDDYFDEED